MNEDQQNLRQSGPWWRPAMQIFSEISTWIAMPIILALIGGKALDQHYGTKPVLFLVLAGLGFIISAYGIISTTKKYNKKLGNK